MQFFKQLRRWPSLLVLLAVSGLMSAAIAVADNSVADGDGVAPVANNDMSAGNVTCGVAANRTAPVAITRNGSYSPGTQVFKKGTTATVSVLSTTGDLTASVPASPDNQISIPSDWDTAANNTMTAAVASTVTVTSSTPGAGNGSVTYRATGINPSGATITRDDTMNVTWNTGTCAPADTTAPTIGYTLTPATPDGDNGWYKGNVTLTWQVDDPQSTVTKTGCVDQSITADQAATDYSCSASSAGGSTGPVTVTIKRDGTAPTVERDVPGDSCADPGDNGWCKGTQTVGFKASDALSGLASGTSPFTKDITTDGASVTVDSGPISDLAGNTHSGITSEGFKVDATDPTVAVTGVSDGATYTLGSVPAGGCTTDDATSGVATSATFGTSGGPVGSVTATCSGAKDNAGNTNSAQVTYNVVYDWTGFFQPIDNGGVFNKAKAGSSIPVKFNLGGDQGLNIFAVGSPSSRTVNCTSSAPSDDIETTATAGQSTLQYDSVAQQYVYVWKTDKAWAGTCRQLTVTLVDGTSHTANFRMTK